MIDLVQEEKQNRRKSAIGTALVFIVVFLLFLLLFRTCWVAPPPPWPKPGGASHIGMYTFAGGEEVSTSPETEPVSEPVEETVTSEVEVPVDIDVTADGEVSITTPEPTVSTPQNTPSVTAPDVFEADAGKGNSEGEGEQGNPDGTNVDTYSQGNGEGEGNGEGNSVSIVGWQWKEEPKVGKITESGYARIEIEVDRRGFVKRARVLETSFSGMEAYLVQEMKKIRFERKASVGLPKALTKGVVTLKFSGR